MTPADLERFEEDIAAEFNAGKIRAPVHLSSGNEDDLIRIFKKVAPLDWVCCSWRSHLHCLLKGVPAAEVKAEIMAGRSIALCFPKHRVISSAIVGGILPIAVGLAEAMKRSGQAAWVHAFLGDMTALGGMAHECMTYAGRHDLPIQFVIEDNGLSVCTPTQETWGGASALVNVIRYRYASKWPHSGAGTRVQF